MKTTSKISKSIFLAIFLTLMAFMTNVGKAQITQLYPIQNTTNCDVNIAYTFVDATLATLCSGNITVSAGTTGFLPNCSGPVYDIWLSVNWVDNSTYTATMNPAGPVDAITNPGNNSSNVTCGSPTCSASYVITCATNIATFN